MQRDYPVRVISHLFASCYFPLFVHKGRFRHSTDYYFTSAITSNLSEVTWLVMSHIYFYMSIPSYSYKPKGFWHSTNVVAQVRHLSTYMRLSVFSIFPILFLQVQMNLISDLKDFLQYNSQLWVLIHFPPVILVSECPAWCLCLEWISVTDSRGWVFTLWLTRSFQHRISLLSEFNS
jgi:hypothetical protein